MANSGKGNLAGRVYTEHSQPVTVITQWRTGPLPVPPAGKTGFCWVRTPPRPPRNVLIMRPGGVLAVRPFRGLRKPLDGDRP